MTETVTQRLRTGRSGLERAVDVLVDVVLGDDGGVQRDLARHLVLGQVGQRLVLNQQAGQADAVPGPGGRGGGVPPGAGGGGERPVAGGREPPDGIPRRGWPERAPPTMKNSLRLAF